MPTSDTPEGPPHLRKGAFSIVTDDTGQSWVLWIDMTRRPHVEPLEAWQEAVASMPCPDHIQEFRL